MNHCSLPSIYVGDKGVKPFQLAQNLNGITAGVLRIQSPLKTDDLGYVFALAMLHRHEKTAVLLAKIVDFKNARVQKVKLLLDLCSTALGLDENLRKRITRFLDQLEHHVCIHIRIVGQIHVRHASAKLADYLVFSEMLKLHHGSPPIPLRR